MYSRQDVATVMRSSIRSHLAQFVADRAAAFVQVGIYRQGYSLVTVMRTIVRRSEAHAQQVSAVCEISRAAGSRAGNLDVNRRFLGKKRGFWRVSQNW